MKKLLIIALAIIVVVGVLYYAGFIYSFRNFGDQGNWRPITEYKILKNKYVTEQSLSRLLDHHPNVWLSGADARFTTDGWYTVSIRSPKDTTQFIFRFRGDDSIWQKEMETDIILFSATDKYYDITPTTIKSISKEYVREKTSLFEDSLIKKLKE